LLLLQPGHETGPTGGHAPREEWVGGSNFEVPANTTAPVPIALTALGEQLGQSTGGYAAEVFVHIRKYGDVGYATGATQLKIVISS
jgi:hypothetical protein